MLYDPKWNAETQESTLEVPGLIAWLETKDPSERYCYTHTGECLISQYLIHLGFENPNVGGRHYCVGDWKTDYPIPGAIHDIAQGNRLDPDQHTFGAALKRAREFAAQ